MPDVGARQRLATALSTARDERAGAEAELEVAEERRRHAEADSGAWSARAEALALALDEARSRAGADRLAAVDGVVGTLLDLVAIDPGWEAAFEAALGETLRAVVVSDPDAGRRALEVLVAGELSGAVVALGATRPQPPSPPLGDRVRPHVRAAGTAAAGSTADPAVEQLLDELLGPVVALASWEEAWQVALAHPAAVVVTLDGARFGPHTWSVGSAGGAQVTAAALEDARAQAARAGDEAREAAVALASTRSTVEVARRREVEISVQLGQALDGARASLEARTREVSARRKDLDVRRAGLEQRHEVLATRLEGLERKLAAHDAQRAAAGDRLATLDLQAEALDRLHAYVGERLEVITVELGELRRARQAQSESTRRITSALDAGRRQRATVEAELAEVRDLVSRAEVTDAELHVKLDTALQAVRHDLDTDPEAAVAAPCPPLPEGASVASRVHDLERELRIMGPINPLALQEYEALTERHQFLQDQLDDVKRSRRELAKVIREVDREIVNVFSAAYADVAANFGHLFATLFPGGQGRLHLTAPDDLLATGIEVEAKPGGKNVKKLSLLSGGERSLTALAFLFAVFRSRPSPFYVMDEVEAALDDINLHRFLDLVNEFRHDAQLVIVSHQKRTMEAADALYGVSMQPGGSSKVVSQKVSEVAPV